MGFNSWEYIYEWITNAYNTTMGIIMALLGYLLPVKDIMLFMIILFLADVLFGYWRAKKIDRAKFQPKIIWNKTVPRLFITVTIITLLFVWDNVYKQDFVKTYSIAGWFVSGLLIASIIDNMYKITGWDVLAILEGFVKSKIEEKTHQKIKDGEKK